MTYRIVRANLTTGAEAVVAVRDELAVATDLVTTLNAHAVGYSFRVEVAA